LLKYSAVTDVGRTRTNNQDGYFVGDTWCVVADGMGGHNGGEVASRTAIEIIQKSLARQSEHIDALLKNAIYQANGAIYGMSLENPVLAGMGTTAVLCYFNGGEAVIAHVGDSRAYHISPRGTRQVTHDHSIVQQLIESGTITPLEAKTHPQKNLITRAIGTESTIEVDVSRITTEKGDRVLLCTDGLTAFVSDADLERVIREHDIETAANRLVALANSGGGTDNITVVLIEI
jgi:protein phosphatase